MKKLEELLNKILDCTRVDLETIRMLVFMVLLEIPSILIAIIAQVYIILSLVTCILVLITSEVLVTKIFFNKFNKYLLQTPKATELIYCILNIVGLLLSWYYFAAFIFLVILAFMKGDYNKTKIKEQG